MQRFMTITAVYSRYFQDAESVTSVPYFKEPFKAQLQGT